MNEHENTIGTVGDYTPAESTHPVLSKLYEQIAQLEKDKEAMRESNNSLNSRYYEIYSNFNNYKYKLENVLRTFAQENTASADLFVEIANEMDIELTNTKDFEVNITFNLTVSAPFGEEIELSEYDVDASIDLSGFDYEVNDTAVVYITED